MVEEIITKEGHTVFRAAWFSAYHNPNKCPKCLKEAANGDN